MVQRCHLNALKLVLRKRSYGFCWKIGIEEEGRRLVCEMYSCIFSINCELKFWIKKLDLPHEFFFTYFVCFEVK